MILYKTIAGEAVTEQIINKSRFISHVKPIGSKEEGELFVKEIKTRYKDATHNVPAIVVGEKQQIQWASDDGEPQGTGGAPIIHYLVEEGITNLVVVITRYFGGIKLGTGGLVRAYSSGARKAVETAVIVEAKEITRVKMELAYNHLPKIEYVCRQENIVIENQVYQEKITLEFLTEPENIDRIKELFTDLTSGQIKWISESKEVCFMP